LSPLLAGFLVLTIGLPGVLLIDLATFLVAVVTYFLIQIPRPQPTSADVQAKGSLWREMLWGWQYIFARPGLLGIVLLGALLNFFNGAYILTVPMVLSFADSDAVGTVLAFGAGGLLVGGSLMSTWGGPRRRILGALSFIALGGLGTITAGWLPSVVAVAAGRFLTGLANAGAGATLTAIEQSKVAVGAQGRVFGAENMIGLICEALAYPATGLLADHVFEPAMAENGALADIFGPLTGVGPGRGMGLLSVLMGLCLILIAWIGYAYPRVRLVEDELPDSFTEVVEHRSIGKTPD
jgi:hypothetical protein